MSKFLALVSFLLLSTSSFADQPAGVNFSVHWADKSSDLAQDHYICVGDHWRDLDYVVDQELVDLKKLFPGIWHTIDGVTNCFSPSDVPQGAQYIFDQMLVEIDQAAGDHLNVSARSDGMFVRNPPPPKYRNEDRSLGHKLLRGEFIIGTIQVAAMGTLMMLPGHITQWSRDYNMGQNIVRAFANPPVWDKDLWYINDILHPVTGAYYYNALRSQGGTRLQSFLYAAVQSAFWEYVIEAVRERPSIQDLIFTPCGGAILGELSHLATLRMRRHGFTTFEKVLVTVINPAYVLNNGYH